MDIPLRILIYQEDGEWLAHLLEMDLVGSGDNADEAMAELKDAFEAQITFCLQNNVDPFRPAPQKYFRQWNKIQEDAMRDLAVPSPAPSDRRVEMFSFTASDRRKFQRRSGFAPA